MIKSPSRLSCAKPASFKKILGFTFSIGRSGAVGKPHLPGLREAVGKPHLPGLRGTVSGLGVKIRLIVGMVCLLLFSGLSIAAPPNPYLFFNEDSTSGELVPKAPQSEADFLEALEGCCFAREQGVLQSDGIEYVLALKIDFSDMPGRREGAAFDLSLIHI